VESEYESKIPGQEMRSKGEGVERGEGREGRGNERRTEITDGQDISSLETEDFEHVDGPCETREMSSQ